MAADSLVGGVYDELSEASQNLIDYFLSDTVDGVVTTTEVGSGTLIVGQGSGGTTQGVLISSAGQVVTGEVDAGGLTLTIALPPGVSFVFEGPSEPVSAEEADAYIAGLLESAFPDPANPERVTLEKAIAELLDALGGTGGTMSVKVIGLIDESTGSSLAQTDGPNDVVFQGTNASELLAFVMSQVDSGKTLVLKDVQGALLVGSGSVRIDDENGTLVFGDLGNQDITGGTGADTLVGGGGADTLTGGGDSDVFGVNYAFGSLTFTDFDVANDKLAFLFAGVDSWDDIAPYFTGLTQDDTGVTAHFGNYTSITFVGVTPEELTIDILTFNV